MNLPFASPEESIKLEPLAQLRAVLCFVPLHNRGNSKWRSVTSEFGHCAEISTIGLSSVNVPEVQLNKGWALNRLARDQDPPGGFGGAIGTISRSLGFLVERSMWQNERVHDCMGRFHLEEMDFEPDHCNLKRCVSKDLGRSK